MHYLSHAKSRFDHDYTDIPSSYSIPRSIALQLHVIPSKKRENVRTQFIPLAVHYWILDCVLHVTSGNGERRFNKHPQGTSFQKSNTRQLYNHCKDVNRLKITLNKLVRATFRTFEISWTNEFLLNVSLKITPFAIEILFLR